jgi:hypothetical protein
MTTPTPAEQTWLMAGWDAKVVARIKASHAKAAFIEASGGLASDKTLRDEFAGQALAGYFANKSTMHMNAIGCAAYIYDMADAMLEARKTTGEGE